jgi:hypothetical protein
MIIHEIKGVINNKSRNSFLFYVARSTVLVIYPEYLAARSRRPSICVHTPSPFIPFTPTSTPCSSI